MTDRLIRENKNLRRKVEQLERQVRKTSSKLVKAKEPSLGALKKRAWTVFSKWVRQTGHGICFTCEKPVEAAKANAGHYIDASICGAILNFHPRNVHVQCVGCNLWKHGNKAVYRVKMVEKYGQAKVDHLDTIRTRTVGIFKPSREYYLSIARKYKELTAEK
jgi:hypothetical protein